MGSCKRIISPLMWAIRIVTILITLLIITHEPPSKAYDRVVFCLLFMSLGLRFRLTTRAMARGLGFRLTTRAMAGVLG